MKKILTLSVLSMFIFMFAISFVFADELVIPQETSDSYVRGDIMTVRNADGSWTLSQINGKQKDGGIHQPIENPGWLMEVRDFFDWGISWADLIMSLAVLLMVFAVVYDVLGFIVLDTTWARYLIAISVALLTSIVGVTYRIAIVMMSIIGDSVILGVGIIIIVAMVFFFLGSFFKGRLKAWGYKIKAKEAGGAFELGATGAAGDVKKTKKVIGAAENN